MASARASSRWQLAWSTRKKRSKGCDNACNKRLSWRTGMIASCVRVLAKLIDKEMPALEVIVFDDTGFPKKGSKSAGVARQYSGTLGRTDNCQVAASVHLAGEKGSACVGMQLYLSEEWIDDAERRLAAG